MRFFSKEARAVCLWALACLFSTLFAIFGGSVAEVHPPGETMATSDEPGQHAAAHGPR